MPEATTEATHTHSFVPYPNPKEFPALKDTRICEECGFQDPSTVAVEAPRLSPADAVVDLERRIKALEEHTGLADAVVDLERRIKALEEHTGLADA